jgi:mRNA interferase MazF
MQASGNVPSWDSKQQQLDKFQELLDTYHFSDIQNLADFLEKSQKEM